MDRSKRHGPNRLGNYLQIHQTVLEHKKVLGAVDEDSYLEEDDSHSGRFLFDGELYLRERALKLTVTKALKFLDEHPADPLVQTEWYSYNVSIVGHGNVFRYCSPHEDDGAPHHEHHHRHQYDPFGPNSRDNEVTIIDGGDWPLLSEVIEEADEWFLANRDRVLALLKR